MGGQGLIPPAAGALAAVLGAGPAMAIARPPTMNVPMIGSRKPPLPLCVSETLGFVQSRLGFR